MIKKIIIITEGQTEETFVKNILVPHFKEFNIELQPSSVTTSTNNYQKFKGGFSKLSHLEKDIQNWMNDIQNQSHCFLSTMLDLYAFPFKDDGNLFNNINQQFTGKEKAKCTENYLSNKFNNNKFIPYIQLHEFEALLFTDTNCIHKQFYRLKPSILKGLNNNIKGLSPEEINDSKDTAPSKRIIKFYPEYKFNKPIYANIICSNIGLKKIREKCPHFDNWIKKLESINK